MPDVRIRFVLLSRNCSRRLRVEDCHGEERDREKKLSSEICFCLSNDLSSLLIQPILVIGEKKWKNSDGFEKKQRKSPRDLSQTYRNLVFIEALTISLPTQSALLLHKQESWPRVARVCQIEPTKHSARVQLIMHHVTPPTAKSLSANNKLQQNTGKSESWAWIGNWGRRGREKKRRIQSNHNLWMGRPNCFGFRWGCFPPFWHLAK